MFSASYLVFIKFNFLPIFCQVKSSHTYALPSHGSAFVTRSRRHSPLTLRLQTDDYFSQEFTVNAAEEERLVVAESDSKHSRIHLLLATVHGGCCNMVGQIFGGQNYDISFL